MPQLLALEWDQFEARVVVAQQRGGDVRIDDAFSVSLAPRDPGQTFADADVGKRLEAALAARHIGKADALVAVGRSSIELRRLTLPPAPEEEWPNLVRFQAMPQFSNLGDDWPLDYFPLASDIDEGASVLAAAISPQLVTQITGTCQSAGLTPTRLVLRPCAAASLLIQRGGTVSHRVRLFVDLLADEADLTVLVETDIVLTRTVRLPLASQADAEHHDGQSAALAGEIRRTIASAQNQLGGQRVGQIVLCGDGDEHREMAKQLSERLDLPVEHFDPFATLRRSSALKSKPPQHPERFAPLLGVIVDEAASRHAIDFLNPRRMTPPRNNRRIFTIVGGLAAVVILTLFAIAWMDIVRLQQRVSTLRQTSEHLDQDVARAREIVDQTSQVEEWIDQNPNWLNELASLSSAERFPAAEDARIASFKGAPLSRGGGQMSLAGYTRDSEVIPEMESLLRDPQHTVIAGPSRESDKDPRYPWRFQETVRIETDKGADASRTSSTRGRSR